MATAALGVIAPAFFAPAPSHAQQKTQSTAAAEATYDARREISVQGSVVSFTTDSVTPPLGTHVLVQTSSGTLDVHLGDGKALNNAHIALKPGDSVRLIGEEIAVPTGGSFFAARILQKGAQSVALRNARGVVLKSMPRDPQSIAALRGVR